MSVVKSPVQERSRRVRKSIAHFASGGAELNTENVLHGLTPNAKSKKSRSRSLGPGGIEALQEASGNRQKPLPMIRSILKPTVPLSPPKPIPPRTPKSKGRRDSPASVSPTRRSTRSATASPRSPGPKSQDTKGGNTPTYQTSIPAVEEQQQALRERERQEALKRRDERRKSLANRRVSFAPEATLHTWDVVEIHEDATTSSEATNSTRRQSEVTNATTSFTHGTQNVGESIVETPSTPPGGDADPFLPTDQRDAHQKKKRRSSTKSQFAAPDDPLSSPTSSLADDDTQQSFMTVVEEEDEDEDEVSDTDTYRDDESTAMDIDEMEIDDESTSRTSGSARTDDTSSSSSSGQLDARLRQAVEQATSQNLAPHEQAQMQHNENLIDLDFESDRQEPQGADEDEGMDMTDAVGGILENQPSSPFETSPVKSTPERRSSRIAKRRSSSFMVTPDEETMDLTSAVGSIRRVSEASRRESGATVATEDEDMSMELTNVVGGLLGRLIDTDDVVDEEEQTFQPDLTAQMDMTTVYGRILSPVTEHTEPSTEASETMDLTTAVGAIQNLGPTSEINGDATSTVTMDITQAMGEILPLELKATTQSEGRVLMQQEAEHAQLGANSSPSKLAAISAAATTTPPHSPQTSVRTPQSKTKLGGLVRNATTPTHQMTPQPAIKPSTPSKTPPNKNVSMRRTSPRKLFSQSDSKQRSGGKTPRTGSAEKRNRRATVHQGSLERYQTPASIQNPQLTLAQPGLGSPNVTELLDRRISIGESARTFTPEGPISRGVRFEDPLELEREVDQQRAEDLHRESGKDAMERETDANADDGDGTVNLRDLIQSMTPKKGSLLRGRKSLAVGSALGLLGKRPVELDEDEEDDTPKRLKGPDHSPVKSIRLPAPPTKEQTIGRSVLHGRVSLGPMSRNIITPSSGARSTLQATTPNDQARFRTADIDERVAPPVSFNQRDKGISPEPQTGDDDSEQIHLQDFLSLINVRFMDLETSKRRHTIAPERRSSGGTFLNDRNLEECVAAGVSTVPMLELYQHSCKELKKYISEGRNIVREIENDTYEENPLLFREYISAAPDMRMLMDTQFKNVKSHARLLSRAMWYEWRMKLLEGLQDGLVKISDNLSIDEKSLAMQESTLEIAVPDLTGKRDYLLSKEERLRRHAEEFAACDHNELKQLRHDLSAADAEYDQKKALLAELQEQKQACDAKFARLNERKRQNIADIETARKLNDEYRGWKPTEVTVLKSEVEQLEKMSGWAVSQTEEAVIALNYKKSLTLALKPSSFMPACTDSSPIGLYYGGYASLSIQQDFILQLLRSRLSILDQASTPIQDVLRLVSQGWDLAAKLHGGVLDLTLGYVTDVLVVDDRSISIKASILLRQTRTRVLAQFDVTIGGVGTEFKVTTKTTATVVYGEEFKESKMGEFLAQKIGATSHADNADNGRDGQWDRATGFDRWAEAVRLLETRLVAQGKKSNNNGKDA